LPLKNTDSFRLYDSENLFIASAVLDINRFFKSEPKYGYLLVIPSRHDVAGEPLNNKVNNELTSKIFKAGLKLYENAPGQISTCLFWIYRGEIIDLCTPGNAERFENFVGL
jgi:hypothetical protein